MHPSKSRTGLERLIFGNRTDRTFLFGIIPNSGYEQVFETEHYYCSVVAYPNQQRVMNFQRIFDRTAQQYHGRLLPVYCLVERGVFGSYFVVYLRKEALAA